MKHILSRQANKEALISKAKWFSNENAYRWIGLIEHLSNTELAMLADELHIFDSVPIATVFTKTGKPYNKGE